MKALIITGISVIILAVGLALDNNIIKLIGVFGVFASLKFMIEIDREEWREMGQPKYLAVGGGVVLFTAGVFALKYFMG